MALADYLLGNTDKILKAHYKTIRRLETLASRRDEVATKLDDAIVKMMDKRDAHLKESLRASRTAEKFKQLLD